MAMQVQHKILRSAFRRLKAKWVGGLTPSAAVVSDASGNLTSSAGVSATELEYIADLTGLAQAQLDTMAQMKTPWAGNKALYSDLVNGGRACESATTKAELEHLSGIDSNVQDQIDALEAGAPLASRSGF